MNDGDTKPKAHHAKLSEAAKSAELFVKAGFSPRAAEAIAKIDAAMTRIRRSMMKREVMVEILKDLDPDLDLARLDVMSAVMHWMPEKGANPSLEVTVGTVAERLSIDPSRASRLVAEVVDLGYIRRTASQADSRRIVLEPTQKGHAFGEAFRRRKSEMMSAGLKDWTEEELVTFARLVDRFTYWGKRGLETHPKAEG